MSDLFWLRDKQTERLRPCLFKSHGEPRVDDRRGRNGIVFVSRNGLHWRDALSEYGPQNAVKSVEVSCCRFTGHEVKLPAPASLKPWGRGSLSAAFDMNEWQKLGSGRAPRNDRFWVSHA